MIVIQAIALAAALFFLALVFCAFYSLLHIPITYITGNMKARRISLALSILGIGVVIAVMLSMKALDRGVTLATESSASKDVLIVMREGAEAEISSWVSLEATQIMLESRVVTAFPLNDQEILCRHLHKVAADWVADYQRETAEATR